MFWSSRLRLPQEGDCNGDAAIVDSERRCSHGGFLGQKPGEKLVVLLDLEWLLLGGKLLGMAIAT